MAKRNGGIIGPDNVPAGPLGAAGGVWRLEDAFNYQKAGLWPVVLGYQIPNSVRFNSASSDYLNRTPASAGNRQKWTYSFWIKKTENGTMITTPLDASVDGNNRSLILFDNDNLRLISVVSGSVTTNLITTQVFRDVSAWYHVIVAFDTTQATASNRVKFYVNGSQVTAFGTATYPSQNQNENINNNIVHSIGRDGTYANQYLNGYMSEIYFIDGQALTPSSFGQTDSATGIWQPIAYTGTYGTNGFYLKFANSASLGTDSSGNGNNFTVNNLTSVDQSYDSPTNNFCTLNTLDKNSSVTLSEGNLKISTSAENVGVFGNFAVSQGKWYFEAVRDNSSGVPIFGIAKANWDKTYVGNTNSIGYASNGIIYANGSAVQSSLATYTTSDVIGIRLDLNGGSITFYKNNVQVGSAVTGLSGEYFPAISGQTSSISSVNFGYPPYAANSYSDANGFGNFSYAVPSGYYSLCSKNLAIYG